MNAIVRIEAAMSRGDNPDFDDIRDVLRSLDAARMEIINLRVKVKFLRERAGYFRDDIEDALAGRDGSTGNFALPGSGSTPEGANLNAMKAR